MTRRLCIAAEETVIKGDNKSLVTAQESNGAAKVRRQTSSCSHNRAPDTPEGGQTQRKGNNWLLTRLQSKGNAGDAARKGKKECGGCLGTAASQVLDGSDKEIKS